MKQPKPILHGRDHELGGADPSRGVGGLPVPPWSVNYETGEVVGRTFMPDSKDLAPLTIEQIIDGEFASLHDLKLVATITGSGGETRTLEIVSTIEDGTSEGINVISGLSGSGTSEGIIIDSYVDTGTAYGARINATNISDANGTARAGYFQAKAQGGDATGVEIVAAPWPGSDDVTSIGLSVTATKRGAGTAHAILVLNGLVDLGLPGLDPGVSGALWNDSGFVAVSP